MKDLLNKFTGGNISSFLQDYYPSISLEIPEINRIKKLANAMEEVIKSET